MPGTKYLVGKMFRFGDFPYKTNMLAHVLTHVDLASRYLDPWYLDPWHLDSRYLGPWYLGKQHTVANSTPGSLSNCGLGFRKVKLRI